MMLDLHHFFAAAANSKGVRLYVNSGLDDQNAFILSDPIKLRQILTNLLGNSFKFTKMGSIEFGYDVVADMLYFYVKDTGVGISPEHKDDIFDRFRQLESPTTKSYGGTGLGLSISKAFVELMGGKIWFTSEQGKGTTFWFSMPFSLGEEKPMLSTLDKPVDYNPLVLIAEDEEINFFLLKEIISSKGVKVVHAKNGQEAVDMVFANPNICLVLMDIKMPVLNGIDAAREIKRSKPDIPIIAQTAFALEYDKDKLNQSCFDDYVTKPISKQELLDLLFIKYKIAPPSS
jgi:CheY-like chemotaxis protein